LAILQKVGSSTINLCKSYVHFPKIPSYRFRNIEPVLEPNSFCNIANKLLSLFFNRIFVEKIRAYFKGFIGLNYFDIFRFEF